MDDVRLTASGLWLDPSELAAPDGALREALNVRIKRANLVEPRPGFPVTTLTGPSGGGWQVFSWDGATYGVFGGELWKYAAPTATEVLYGAASLSIASDSAFAEPMGRNFYVVTSNGVFRIDTPGATSAVPAGVAALQMPQLTAISGSGVPNDDQVAIRCLFAETVNGQLLLGPPCPPLPYANTSGSSKGVSLEVVLPSTVRAGMQIHVYRTEVVDIPTPTGDEMALERVYTITSADVTAGYATVTVLTASADLGASLYTNETQEGILQANYAPPNARAIAWWKGIGFYGDIFDNGYILQGDSQSPGVNPGSLDQIDSGNTTAGSPTITGLTDGTAFIAGMYLSSNGNPGTASANFAANSRVVSSTATTVTMDKNAVGTGATTVNGHGVLTVDGEEFISATTQDLGNRQFASRYDLVALVAAHTDVTLEISDYVADTYTLTWRSGATFAVSYDGAYGTTKFAGLYGTADTNATAATDYPSRVMWSKSLQPEAVPLVNFQDLGDWRAPVLRLLPTRDSLFVLKADGVWRITGDSPETLSIEEFDRSVRLIHRRAADVFENEIYAWTRNGIVSMSEAGVNRISEQAIGVALEASQANIVTLGLSAPPGGCFIAGCPTQECVLVGVPSSTATGAGATSEYIYVLEAKTGAWVRWQAIENVDWRGAVEHAGRMLLVGEGAALLYQDDDATDADVAVTITNAAETSATIALLGGGGVGFRVTQGAVESWLTSFLGSATYTTTAELANGAATASFPFDCIVEWVAAPTSGALMHFRQLRAQYASFAGVWRALYSFSSERVPTAASVYVDTPDPSEAQGVTPHRVYVTRAHSRCARLRPTLTIESAGQSWALNGITLTYEPMRGGERMP